MRYCVTAGRGMEPFVRKHLERIPNVKVVEILEGKVFFEADISSTIETNNLRCVERLFLVVAYETMERNWNKRQLFDKLFGLFDGLSLSTVCEEAFRFLLQNTKQQSADRTFRVSLKATGKWRRKIDTEELSASVACRIKQVTTGFRSSLRHATMEICIHISEKYIFIGIPITREPLSKRAYLLHNALRSTIVDAMLSMANIRDGDIVMDLACGSSSILLQAAHDFRDTIFLLGVDFCWDALQLSLKNRDHLRISDSRDPLLNLLSMNLFHDCFKYAAIDHIISDLPFGQLHGTNESALLTLQRVCDIFSRIGSSSTDDGCYPRTAVLLISSAHLTPLSSMLKLPTRLKQHHPISLGTTQAIIVLLANDIDPK